MALETAKLEDLKKLEAAKMQWETGDDTAKASATKQAEMIRQQMGIKGDTATLADVQEQIRLRQPVASPTSGMGTPQSNIADLASAQKQKTINELEQAFRRSQGELDVAQEKGVKGFESQRSGIREQNVMQSKALENFLAEKGLGRSGSATQGNIAQSVALQGGLGASTLGQQQFMSDIDRQRANLVSDKEFGIAQAGLTTDINAMQQALEQARYDEGKALQIRSLDLQEKGMNINQANQQAQLELQQAGVTGEFQGEKTLQAKQMDESVRQFEANYGLNLRQMTFNEAQAQIQNAMQNRQISISAGNLALSRAKMLADQDPNSLDNQIKAERLRGETIQNEMLLNPQATEATATPSPIKIGEYIDEINSSYFNPEIGIKEGEFKQFLDNLYYANAENPTTITNLAALKGYKWSIPTDTTMPKEIDWRRR